MFRNECFFLFRMQKFLEEIKIIIQSRLHIKETLCISGKCRQNYLLFAKAKQRFLEHRDTTPVVTSQYSYIKNIRDVETF
jgi:hypothetical protein